MINEDIRHIVEAELREDEELLWAEKVDENLRKKWILESIKQGRFWAFPFFVIGVLIVWMTLNSIESRHRDTSLWIVIVGMIPFLLLGCLFFLASIISFKDFFGNQNYMEKRPFKFYALTNFRVLYFGKNDELLFYLDASHAKKAKPLKRWYFPNKWETLCLIVSPVGTGIFKFAEIYFLSDFKKSQNEIESALQGHPS